MPLKRLSGRSDGDLRTRAGVDSACAEIRARFPEPEDTRPRLRITTKKPAETDELFEQAQRVMELDPRCGIFTFDWETSDGMMKPVSKVSSPESVPPDLSASWDLVCIVGKACHTSPRNIKNSSELALYCARAAPKLTGKAREGALRAAKIPRAHPVNANTDAIAYAHAPRHRGAIGVVVEDMTDAQLRRRYPRTGIRPVNPLPWHRDPTIDANLAAIAAAAIERRTACYVMASQNDVWSHAVLAELEGGGYEAYLLRPDGRIQHLDVKGRGTWASIGAEAAVRLAAVDGQPVGDHERGFWPISGEDRSHLVPEVGLGLHAPEQRLNQSQLIHFQYRLAGVLRRKVDAAVIAFEAALPDATARLARLILPIRAWDQASNQRFGLNRANLEAAVAASAHADPAAVMRAVSGRWTRALVLAAALQGPWRVASDLLASGASHWRALHAYAEATAGHTLPKAALKTLIEGKLSRWDGHDLTAAVFADEAKLVALLWAGVPCRPVMTHEQLHELKWGLGLFGFVEPSAAGQGDRTWNHASTTLAYANALRRDVASVPGSATFGPGIRDLVHFIDRALASIELAPEASEAARCAILVPPGRLMPALERMSASWHVSINAMDRERQALLGELIGEEQVENALRVGKVIPEYPTPLSAPVAHEDVMISPLRGPKDFETEAREMNNCVASYRDDARVGSLLVFSLRSPRGRSTLGLQVHDFDDRCQMEVFQHMGHQGRRVEAPPPDGHVEAASWLVTALRRPDGGLGGPLWRETVSAARRAHRDFAREGFSEQSLSVERRRKLAALDLAQLGEFLGKNQRKLNLEQFRLWAQDLAVSYGLAERPADMILGMFVPGRSR